MQRVFDGREPLTDFGRKLFSVVGETKEAIFAWMGKMKQGECASLSPIVVEFGATDAVAARFLAEAGREIEIIGKALRATAPALPLAICGGGLSEAMRPYIPAEFLATTSRPQKKDSCAGALILIHKAITG